MSHFKATMHQNRFLPGFRPAPLGELTALPQTYLLDLRGPTYKGGEWSEAKKGEGLEGEDKGGGA